MQYQFTKHTNVGGRFEDRITVTRTRHVGFPTQFYKDNDLDKYKCAVLYYDKANNAIGVKFVAEAEEGSIVIQRNSRGYGGYIPATNFFKLNRINTKRFAGRYDYKKIPLSSLGFEETGELFVIELKPKEEKEEPPEQS